MSGKLLEEDFIARLRELELVSRKVVSGLQKGERRSRRRGQSTEFADHRPYVVGDDIRFLDWNIYGRLDKLFLKLFLEEEDLRVNILLDRSASMGHGAPEKLLYAKQVAAALGFIALHNQDRVRVGAFSDRIAPVFGPARGRHQVRRLLDSLERLEPALEGGTDLAAGARSFALAGRLTGITVLLSDFFDRSGFEGALRYIQSGGPQGEVYLFHILAPQEVDPALQGDLRLVDCEDGLEAEVSITGPLLRTYRRNLDAFRSGIKDFATRRGMHYVFASTDVPFDRLVLDYLRKRGLLK